MDQIRHRINLLGIHKDPDYFMRRLIFSKTSPEEKEAINASSEDTRLSDKSRWNGYIDRGYAHYNYVFREFGLDIVDIIKAFPKGYKVNILDSGAGEGVFLSELARMVKPLGTELDLSALVLDVSSNKGIKELLDKEVIARAHSGFLQNPEVNIGVDSYDIIFDFMGPIRHIHNLKEYFMAFYKYMNSLKVGGRFFGIVNVKFISLFCQFARTNISSLSSHPLYAGNFKIYNRNYIILLSGFEGSHNPNDRAIYIRRIN